MRTASRPLRPGEAVRVRGERWRVRHVTMHGACGVVELTGADAGNAGVTGRFLVPFDQVGRLPPDLECPRVVRAGRWRRIAREALASATPAWTSLRAAAQARIAVLPYQLEPALAMVRGVACRMLLADEVGLGKTIQAGLLVAELLARERDARALIVTPASLREQWRDELRDRFGIDASIVDAAALARASGELPADVNPWAVLPIVIASIDFLKRPDVIRALEPLVWDLVAFDEAHALGGASDRARAADLLARRGRRVVTITATPHNGDDRAFERLCALGRLQPSEPLLIFRRSRDHVGMARARSMRSIRVAPTRDEIEMHRVLAAYAARVARDAPADAAAGARLAMIVLRRRACSSPASLARSVERRMTLLADVSPAGAAQLSLPLGDEGPIDDEEPDAVLAVPGMGDRDAERRWLERILGLARAVRRESKIAALSRLLRRIAEPAIVFTEYRDTLHHVRDALRLDAAVLHGGMTAAERAAEARRFTHGMAPLLLATDAASEGLNLHQRCRLVVNLEVPWTPLRLEQRVGRVDRLGQGRRVHAVTLAARDEARMASALAARSDTADGRAPFGAAAMSIDSEATPVALDVDGEAEAEAERIAWSRAMGRGSLEPVARRPSLYVSRRARLRRATRGCRAAVGNTTAPDTLWIAMRLYFVDACGAPAWDTVGGVAMAWRAPLSRRAADARHSLHQALDSHGMSLAAASAALHERVLTRFRSEICVALAPLAARERAILDHLAGDGRLGAPLLQPGLFDRRAAREAEAMKRVVEQARARAGEYLARLDRLERVTAGDRRVVFAIASAP